MSLDAARWGPLLIALRNQTCLTAVWVQADARVALGCCRTADTLFQPPAHPQRLSWPVHSRGWAGCQLPETTCISSHACLHPAVDRGHVAPSCVPAFSDFPSRRPEDAAFKGSRGQWRPGTSLS